MLRARSGSSSKSAPSRRARSRTWRCGGWRARPSLATGSACPGRDGGFFPVSMPRLAAALVAIVCWAGLAAQFAATYGQQHDVLASLWIIARFFTILANLVL